MPSGGPECAGRGGVDLEVANGDDLILADRGRMRRDQVRREVVRGVVNPSVTRLVLPETVVQRLGLPLGALAPVRYTDGRRGRLPLVHGVFVRLLGRDGVYTAISDPNRETAILGAIVLADLDLVVDDTGRRLVPRDPRGPICEMGW
jgi:hypothetical protein